MLQTIIVSFNIVFSYGTTSLLSYADTYTAYSQNFHNLTKYCVKLHPTGSNCTSSHRQIHHGVELNTLYIPQVYSCMTQCDHSSVNDKGASRVDTVKF